GEVVVGEEAGPRQANRRFSGRKDLERLEVPSALEILARCGERSAGGRRRIDNFVCTRRRQHGEEAHGRKAIDHKPMYSATSLLSRQGSRVSRTSPGPSCPRARSSCRRG